MQMSKQELANSAGNYAGSLMRDGYSPHEIIAALLEEGLNQDDAVAIVRQLLKLRADDIRQQAQPHLLKAGISLIVSIVLGMFVNGFYTTANGYFLMLIAFGFAAYELHKYYKAIQEADRIQSNWTSAR